MKTLTATLLMCLLTLTLPIVNAQIDVEPPTEDFKSVIETGSFLTANKATLSPREDGRVDIFVSGLDGETRNVAILTTPYRNAIVRAFEMNTGLYNRVSLKPAKTPGKFTLDQSGTWSVEVIGIYKGELRYEVFDNVTVGESTVIDVKPPEDDSPISDMSDLTDLTISTLKMVGNQPKLQQYLDSLKEVKFEGSLSEVKTKIGDIRRSLLVGEVKGDWYKLFQMVDDEFSEVKSVSEYERHWQAVMKGLTKFIEQNEIKP